MSRRERLRRAVPRLRTNFPWYAVLEEEFGAEGPADFFEGLLAELDATDVVLTATRDEQDEGAE